MPARERTTLGVIVRAGRDLLESKGLEGLTMQAVADQVGVKAPSLYKRVRNRDGLVTLVVEATVLELGERLDASVDDEGEDPRHKLVRLARAARQFAHAHPAGFRLVFAPGPNCDSIRATWWRPTPLSCGWHVSSRVTSTRWKPRGQRRRGSTGS